MDGNSNVAPSVAEEQPFISGPECPTDQNTQMRFGWGKFRPKCLQFLDNPKWFLVCLIMYTVSQGICVLGLLNLILPSIEKRFSLTAKEMGIIAAANDVSALLLVVFISFYGDYGNKIKWIGGGGILVGIGALLFALPHVLIGRYEPSNIGALNGGLCYNGMNGDQMKCTMESDSRWYYIFIFVSAQVIIGAGVSPFYSLVPAYLDENVHPKSMPVYLGIWHCAVFVGPGAGMAVGGKLLSIYVDIKQPAGVDITAADPRWIGAWWLGFVFFGFLILTCAAVLLGFPRDLPGAKEMRRKHIEEGNLRKADNIKKPSFKSIFPELKNLLTNWTFLFNTLGSTITVLFYGALGPFYAKILQLKFGLKPEDTGYALAVMITPTMAVGVIVGSIFVKKFALKDVCKKAALLIFVLRIIGIIGPISFTIPGCRNVELAEMGSAGKTALNKADNAEAISSFPKTSLKTTCNSRCLCSLSRFAPVCGSDNLTYFDACHAGCKSRVTKQMFGNCSCTSTSAGGSQLGTAKAGFCDRDCKNFLGFVILIAISVTIQFAKVVPGKTVILRCVPDNKRAFATGIQYVSTKTLGFLPGPILFGHVIDSACRLWQDTCGKKGRCFVYDIDKLSITILIFGAVITVVSTVCYFFSWYLYKPDDAAEEEAIKDSSNLCNDTKV